MFKNAILYRIAANPSPTAEFLQSAAFVPCGATQPSSSGWVPPRGIEHGALAEFVAGQWILKHMTETKKIPADVLGRAVAARCKLIEDTTGRKPGRKETREIKEEVTIDLLPSAFPARTATLVWIDPASRLLLIDTASQARADEVVTGLVNAMPGLMLAPINVNTAPAASMAHWLYQHDNPPGFMVERQCELKATDESKAKVKYDNHDLFIDEVKQHIKDGLFPTRLALSWLDRVSFVLTETLTLKKIEMLEPVLQLDTEPADNFDADAAIATGELSQLIPDLLAILGGEAVVE